MSTFQEKTDKLRFLISKTKKSAKQAWQAGEILCDIEKNNEYYDYKTFDNYTKQAFSINKETAKQYINIFQKIPFDLLTDNMLVSHLYTIAEMQDKLKLQVLTVMRSLENDELKGRNYDKELPYNNQNILILKHILEAAKDVFIDSTVKSIFNKILEFDNQEVQQKKREKRDPLEDSEPLEDLSLHEKYVPVLQIYSHIPISEQGLVGLFCTIFHLIKREKFVYQKHTVNFEKILYIRTEFPDACIKIAYEPNDDKLQGKDIHIEFELKSYNYWKHKHNESTDICHIIICWEDNIEFEPIKSLVTRPLILCIKELLKTGEITLH